MGWIVGAYAASPCHTQWRPEDEAAFIAGLRRIPAIGGLELPFYGNLHRFDDAWLLDRLVPEWDYVLTAIPGVMGVLADSPRFGLASDDEAGRAEAVRFTGKMRQAALAINARLGRQAVRAVELHSAPTLGRGGVQSSAASFARSLTEIAAWDWQGATLLVEHCDRWIPGQTPAKGFLPLEDELEAIRQSAAGVRILVNWGRSAIEGRDPELPLAHLQRAAEAGLCGGVIFSGATVGDPLYGTWADSHAPFGGSDATPTSLMTPARVSAALRAAGDARVRGFKIQALPKTLSVAERVERIAGWCAWLDACAGTSL